jgi:hypothetical protein
MFGGLGIILAIAALQVTALGGDGGGSSSGAVYSLPAQPWVATGGATTPFYGISTAKPAVYVASRNQLYVSAEMLNGTNPATGARFNRMVQVDLDTGAVDVSWCFTSSAPAGDDHGVGSLELLHDGRIIAAGGNHNANIKLSVEVEPGSNKYRALAEITDIKATYVTLHAYNNQLHTLARHDNMAGASRYELYFKETTAIDANGTPTWAAAVKAIDMGADSRLYRGNHILRGSVLWFCCTRANAADDYRRNVYFVGLDLATKTLRNWSGSHTLAQGSWPLTQAMLDADYKLYTHGGSSTGVSPHIAFDEDDYPVIVLLDGPVAGGTADIKVIAWNGTIFETPLTIAQTDTVINGATIAKRDDGVDVYYTFDGAGAYIKGGSAYYRRRVDGIWQDPKLRMDPERPGANPLANICVIENHTAAARVVFCENYDSTTGASTPGDLRIYIGGDDALVEGDGLWKPYMLSNKLRRLFLAEAWKSGFSWYDCHQGREHVPTASPTVSATGFRSAAPAIEFNGTTQYFTGTGTSGLPTGSETGEMLALVDPDDTALSRHVMAYGSTTGSGVRRSVGINTTDRPFVSDNTVTIINDVANNDPAMIDGRFEAAQISGRLNGGPFTTSSAAATVNTGTERCRVGASCAATANNFFDGKFAMGAIVGDLTTAERQKTEGWGADRYVSTDLLAADHPHKNAPPPV